MQAITELNVIRHGLVWFVPLMAIAGAVALLLALIAHPRQSDAVFGIGLFLLFSAVAAAAARLDRARLRAAGGQRRHVGRR